MAFLKNRKGAETQEGTFGGELNLDEYDNTSLANKKAAPEEQLFCELKPLQTALAIATPLGLSGLADRFLLLQTAEFTGRRKPAFAAHFGEDARLHYLFAEAPQQ